MEHKTDCQSSREVLSGEKMLDALEEMRMLNKELLEKREQEILLQFPLTGNLGHWYWNILTDNITNHSRRLESLGYQSEELPNPLTFSLFEKWIHPDDYQRVKTAILAHLEGRATLFEESYRLRAKSGEYLWYYNCARVTQYDDNGTPLLMTGVIFDITERMHQEQLLRDREERDCLTQLYHCEKMLSVIDGELFRSSSLDESGMIVLDIDHFCTVNAVVGQRQADTILQKIADILRTFENTQAIIGRAGGDEFVLFLPRVTQSYCHAVAKKLQQKFEEIYLDAGKQYRLSISIGMSISREKDSQILLDNAMVALCHAKKSQSTRIAQYERLESYVGFLRTYPVSEVECDIVWREDIVTFAYRTMDQVTNVKNALHVLFSRVARQYSIKSISVTAVGDHGWTEEVIYLWDEENGFIPSVEKIRLSEAEYHRRAEWLAGNSAMVMAPIGLDDTNEGVLTGRLGGKTFPQLYCPVYIQGIYQGNVIFAARKMVHSWDRRVTHQLRVISNILYSAINKKNAENTDHVKTEFLSRMSREVRIPLNTLVSMLEILKNNMQDMTRQIFCINKIEASAQYLLSLVYDVMEMSRREVGYMGMSDRNFSINHTIDLVERLIRGVTEDGPLFRCSRQILHDELTGDSESLHQILLNLTVNAIKFTPKSGRVGLDVREIDIEENGCCAFDFVVWDTGIGIPEKGVEYFNSVLKKETDDHSGIGTGLSACIQLLSDMGSYLHVESREGVGSRFSFRVKLAERKKNANKKVFGELSGCRLLAVDDNEMNRETVRELLESRGAQVEIACDGKQAIEIFMASLPGYFDLVLTDINMPVLNGVELARRIRALPRIDANLPIIAASTDEVEGLKKNESKDFLFTDQLVKPVDINRLVRCICAYFKRHSDKYADA